MKRKRYTPEQIIGKRREAEVALAHGETVARSSAFRSGVGPGLHLQKFIGATDTQRGQSEKTWNRDLRQLLTQEGWSDSTWRWQVCS